MNTQIIALKSDVIDLGLYEPFTISGGTHASALVVIIQIVLSNGIIGTGEAAPLAPFNGETVGDVLTAVALARPVLEGADAADWRKLASQLHVLAPHATSAVCALETAIHDALARCLQVPLSKWFGGMSDGPLISDVTIPIGDAARGREDARMWYGRGFQTLKVKVNDSPGEARRILSIHQGAPAAAIILDGNGGLQTRAAEDLILRLRSEGLELALFEQPVEKGDWHGLRHLAGLGVRIALDESVATSADALNAANHLGDGHVINIKLMKSGIAEAMDIVAVARATGMGLMIGGMVESILAMTTSACFAAGLGAFEFVDLDTPLFMRGTELEGGFRFEGSTLHLDTIIVGHGVTFKGSLH
jgi:L-alanine-DL-glutamate epimerase-like enolase superfamily enzyme